jgi:glycosyltransferase 2 family protein
MSRLSRAVSIARALFLPVALVVLGYAGVRAARATDLSSVHRWPLVGAYVASLAWWVCLALGWASLVSGETDRGAAVRSWCRTQVARYVPGGIWAVLARATTVPGRVRDKVTAVTAENVVVLMAALAVGGAGLAVVDARWVPVALLVAVPFLGSGVLGRRTQISRGSIRRTCETYLVGYLAYGVSAVLVQAAVSGSPRSPVALLHVAGAACLAWAVGLVVIIAPGGVGIREVVYVWMLHGVYPQRQLEVAAVTSRLLTVVAELTVLVLVSAVGRSRATRAPVD